MKTTQLLIKSATHEDTTTTLDVNNRQGDVSGSNNAEVGSPS